MPCGRIGVSAVLDQEEAVWIYFLLSRYKRNVLNNKYPCIKSLLT